jgi:hypothetical protein
MASASPSSFTSLGGLISVYSSSMLDSVNYLPGGYSVRYGRNLGGVIHVETRDTLPDSKWWVCRHQPLGLVGIFLWQTRSTGVLWSPHVVHIPTLANPLLEQHHGNSDSVPALGTGMHSSSWTAISQTTATTSSSSFRPPMTGLQFLGNAGDGADEESANAAAFST